MVIEYKRNLQQNYMVIRDVEEEIIERMESFCIKMLEENVFNNIIPFETRHINDKTHFYYDISSKQSFENIYIKSTMSYEQVRHLLLNIIDTVEESNEYLLNENDFILKAKYIYLDLEGKDANLCYLSGYHRDIKKQISELLEYMMNKVDYNDRAAVLLVYNLYAVCKEDGYTFAHLKEAILSSNKKEAIESKKHFPDHNTCNNDIKKSHPETKIPLMKEKIIGEKECTYYSTKTYLLTAGGILGGLATLVIIYNMGLVHNTLGTRIDYGRLFFIMVIFLCLEVYLMKKLWNKDKKVTGIVTKEEYIQPLEEVGKGEALSVEEEDDYNPTCLLSDINNEAEKESTYYLKPVKKDVYETIHIDCFPYFIGKLKKQMDYCLDQQGVSRYHAKITKEDDRFYITDLNSTNGTYLNGKIIESYQAVEIGQGDQITLADIIYTYNI